MYVGQLNMQKYAEIKDYTEFITQVRYNSSGTLSKIVQQGDQMEVEFFFKCKRNRLLDNRPSFMKVTM